MIEGIQSAEAQQVADDCAREEIAVADAHLVVPEQAHVNEPLENRGNRKRQAQPGDITEASLRRRDEKTHHSRDGVAGQDGEEDADDV